MFQILILSYIFIFIPCLSFFFAIRKKFIYTNIIISNIITINKYVKLDV